MCLNPPKHLQQAQSDRIPSNLKQQVGENADVDYLFTEVQLVVNDLATMAGHAFSLRCIFSRQYVAIRCVRYETMGRCLTMLLCCFVIHCFSFGADLLMILHGEMEISSLIHAFFPSSYNSGDD